MIDLLPLSAAPPAAVEVLLDRAFGPDRFARTAYKVRGDAVALPRLSFAALEDGALVGSIQCWPVALHLDAGESICMVMVGPVAVSPERQQGGLGRRLMDTALAAAADTGEDRALCLIGDPEYYARFFGFSDAHTGRWRLPGPVERRRLLARGANVPDAAGLLGPRVSMPA